MCLLTRRPSTTADEASAANSRPAPGNRPVPGRVPRRKHGSRRGSPSPCLPRNPVPVPRTGPAARTGTRLRSSPAAGPPSPGHAGRPPSFPTPPPGQCPRPARIARTSAAQSATTRPGMAADLPRPGRSYPMSRNPARRASATAPGNRCRDPVPLCTTTGKPDSGRRPQPPDPGRPPGRPSSPDAHRRPGHHEAPSRGSRPGALAGAPHRLERDRPPTPPAAACPRPAESLICIPSLARCLWTWPAAPRPVVRRCGGR